MQVVSLALLEGVESQEEVVTQLARVFQEQGGADYVDGIVSSLSYLRDRIGVPRDMKLPAARQLRAHLNWAIDKIVDA